MYHSLRPWTTTHSLKISDSRDSLRICISKIILLLLNICKPTDKQNSIIESYFEASEEDWTRQKKIGKIISSTSCGYTRLPLHSSIGEPPFLLTYEFEAIITVEIREHDWRTTYPLALEENEQLLNRNYNSYMNVEIGTPSSRH